MIETSNMESRTLCFYTVGDNFTQLLRSFIDEGRVKAVLEILRDGGMPENMIPDFFRGKLVFEGDTREGDGSLSIVPDVSESYDGLEQCIISLVSNCRHDYDMHKMFMSRPEEQSADLLGLISVFGLQNLVEEFAPESKCTLYHQYELRNRGIELILAKDVTEDTEVMDGAILQDGSLVVCGYQEHSWIYKELYDLGLSSASCWTNDDQTFHISSRQLSGTLSHLIDHYSLRGKHEKITKGHLDTLFKLRNQIEIYGAWGGKGLAKNLKNFWDEKENHGGKWNGLAFLKRFYPEFRLPAFSKEPIPNVKNCIRTSPKYSLPGLLESKFDISENSISEIEQTFEKYKDVRDRNELHYFYQEFIEGVNGVCHCDEQGFRYSCSSKQGDIVQGQSGNVELNPTVLNNLEFAATCLFKDLNRPIQIEFVVNENDNRLYLVQLRLLENTPERTVRTQEPDWTKCIAIGLTFSRGSEDINVADILVVDEDADSTQLIGKKGLVVKNKVEFSHILALSSALKIPSMYGTGDFQLPEEGLVRFCSYNQKAWILPK